MFNRVSAGILTVILVGIAWLSTSGLNPSTLTLFAIATSLFIVCTFLVNWWRLGLVWPHLLLPTFYLAGVGFLFVSISSPSFRLLFLVAAALVFYAVEMQLGRESHFLQNVYLFSVFAIFSGLEAMEFYFRLSPVFTAVVVFVFSYILIVQGFAGFSLPAKKYFNLLIALACSEIAFGLALWPTYYMVNAVVLFVVFYLLWIFSFSAFFGKLTSNKIYLQLALVFLILAAVLGSANFKPLTK